MVGQLVHGTAGTARAHRNNTALSTREIYEGVSRRGTALIAGPFYKSHALLRSALRFFLVAFRALVAFVVLVALAFGVTRKPFFDVDTVTFLFAKIAIPLPP